MHASPQRGLCSAAEKTRQQQQGARGKRCNLSAHGDQRVQCAASVFYLRGRRGRCIAATEAIPSLRLLSRKKAETRFEVNISR
jgi:hypothetical protein